ncbi:MAG: alpha/beta hydrolase [Sphaerochaetaceae bacterium]|nr:alpha/beta hydrolase [Sphaerochaetaceae bacterium]MDC7236196.1 alpha/beta hydrolase [Sphaerochaetaceae bacterium]MDC7250928.1 alpha/beta hydrolase [Sphaerochaetaceae bacterium]
MKIDKEMIDKEYRVGIRLAKVILNPTIKRYKQINKLNSRLIGKPLKKFNSKQFFIEDKNKRNKVRVRVYNRKNHNHDCPGILYLHGGGFVLNYPENSHGEIKHILNSLDCVVVAPDYRRSLESPYPAAVDDCYQALLWMKNNSSKLGFRSDQVFVMGKSAGGGLVVSLCLLARDLNQVSIAYQFPISPMLDDRMQTQSMKDNDAPIWNEPQNRFAWDLYLNGIENVPIYASPARCEDYSNLPPASSYVGTLDPFFDETVTYFNNLTKANIENNLMVFENVYHGFVNTNPVASKTIEAKAFITNELIKAKDSYFKKQP